MKSWIPKNAKVVFKGKIFDVYQWNQKQFDGSFKIYERVKRPDVTTIIATVGNKIIIQDQEQPSKGKSISVPGGRCELGETPRSNAKKELLEETGYTSTDIKLWKIFYPSESMVFSEYFFIFRNCRKIQEPELEPGERIKNHLIGFEEFLKLSDNEKFRHKGLLANLLRMRLYPEEKKKFKKLLFG